MSIRNLGDWSPVGRDSDPVHADPEMVASAQTRYEHITTTLDDAIARLEKVVATGSSDLNGQYVDALRKSATSLQDRLTKAATRYRDVAAEIKRYEPDLDHGLSESARALEDARAAKDAQTKADAMPDPQHASDGTVSPDEQAKGDAKNGAVATADGDMSAARHRLESALDALDVAGKRFGDAVSARRYDDGLTDTSPWRLNEIMKVIAKVFAIIGMVLAVVGMFIPGVNALVLAGVAASAVGLVASSVLYADGQGSVVDVILGAVGLGFAGLGAAASVFAKGLASGAQQVANLTEGATVTTTTAPRLDFAADAFGDVIEMVPMARPAAGAAGVIAIQPGRALAFLPVDNAATNWRNLADWFNLPGINSLLGKGGFTTPTTGFWASAGEQVQAAGAMWANLFKNPADFAKTWAGVVGGYSGFRDLSGVLAAVGGTVSPAWFVWGGLNGALNLGGLIYTGGRLQGWIPDVPGPVPVAVPK